MSWKCNNCLSNFNSEILTTFEAKSLADEASIYNKAKGQSIQIAHNSIDVAIRLNEYLFSCRKES